MVREGSIGLMLDLGEGTLSVYKNGRRLGVMGEGLDGEYCWFVSVLAACKIRMSKKNREERLKDYELATARQREADLKRRHADTSGPVADREFKEADEALKIATEMAGKSWAGGYSKQYWIEREQREGYSPVDITKSCFVSLLDA